MPADLKPTAEELVELEEIRALAADPECRLREFCAGLASMMEARLGLEPGRPTLVLLQGGEAGGDG